MNAQNRYLEDVVSGPCDYAEDRQLVHDGLLESEDRSTSRPPVVRRGAEIGLHSLAVTRVTLLRPEFSLETKFGPALQRP